MAIDRNAVIHGSVDLVDLVKAIVGDVETVQRARRMVQVYREARSLRLRVIFDGCHILGTWIVPLPETVTALAADKIRNPYNTVGIEIELTDELPAPPPVEVPHDA